MDLLWLFAILTVSTICFAEVNIVNTNYTGKSSDVENSFSMTPYRKVGNKYYYLEHETKVNWFKAADACRRLNGNLATFNSDEEYQHAVSFVSTMVKGTFNIWLSGHGNGDSHRFTSVATGFEMTYYKWLPGEPNNKKKNENCVELRTLGGMNDENCMTKGHYLCEANQPQTITLTAY